MNEHTYTYGVEEEFFLSQGDTGNIATRMPQAFLHEVRRRLGERASNELLQSQIELVTPVCGTVAELERAVVGNRRVVGEIAKRFDIALVSAGTHPLAEWREQNLTQKPRYRQLVSDFQIVGRRNLLCGLHVHVAPPPDQDRVDVMNRILAYTPIFLALSCSSPFWNRQGTGLMSYRQAAYDEWPRTGIPEFFNGEADYNAFVHMLVQAGVIENASFLWWAVRVSANYPTIELRIADACTDVRDTLCIADLFRCLVRAAVRNPSLGRARMSTTRLLIEENRWQAKRHGIAAQFIDEFGSGERMPLAERMEQLFALIADDVAHFGCEAAVAQARHILVRGSSADLQIAEFKRARDTGATRPEACREVARWLAGHSAPAHTLGPVQPDISPRLSA
ncbi:MAG: carboxylate-amine ligase [Xanthomonadales bacterium]|nr:carboxylate-amine ligase [Xanthomonadales bacterium]MBK7144388.1 carboxylate-amine ligase [Xanthomonadales bacterium]MCC6562815.1 carboxylate-amine ligase [Xanthomonadales bacterium]